MARGVFDEVQISFLIKGHTHFCPDQMFSRISVRLCNRDDIYCVEDFLSELMKSQQPDLPVEQVDACASIKQHMENNKLIRSFDGQSASQCFKIVRCKKTGDPRYGQPVLYTRGSSSETRKALEKYPWSHTGVFILLDHIDFLKIGPAELRRMKDEDLEQLESTIEGLKTYRPNPQDLAKIQQLEDTVEELKAVNDVEVPFHWVVDKQGRLEYEPGYSAAAETLLPYHRSTGISREHAEALGPREIGDSSSDEDDVPIAALLLRQQMTQPDISSDDEAMDEENRRVPCSPMKYDEGEYQVRVGRNTRRVAKRFAGKSTAEASGGICAGVVFFLQN